METATRTYRPTNKPDTKDWLYAERMIARAKAEGRWPFVGTEFQNGDRVVSNGVGVLPIPKGTTGKVVYRYPCEQWKPDMSGWTGRLEWGYAVRWDDKTQNNPGNRPTGCHWEMLEPEVS
jgi:hypothetical protein